MLELDPTTENSAPLTNENFADLLEESFKEEDRLQGRVINGKILAIENDIVIIDVGLKSEGAVTIR